MAVLNLAVWPKQHQSNLGAFSTSSETVWEKEFLSEPIKEAIKSNEIIVGNEKKEN